MDIYYLEGQEQRGPIDRKDFVQLVHAGKVQAQTLVYTAAIGEWKPYVDAYYDLFPESRPAFAIQAPDGQAHTAEPGVKDMASASEGDGGIMTHLYGFYTLHSFWIKIGLTALALILLGNWFAANRKKWFEDAVTMKDKAFEVGEARDAIKDAAKEWKKTLKLVKANKVDEAQLSYDKGYQEIRFAYNFHRQEEVKDGQTVGQLVQEAIRPVNDEINRQFTLLLDDYAAGKADAFEVEEFRWNYSHFAYSNIYRVYEKRMDEIDTARAKLAPKIFRIQLHLDDDLFYALDEDDRESEEYRRITQAIRDAVTTKFKPPPGYTISLGAPVGPKEYEATFFSCNVRVGFGYEAYYFETGKTPEHSLMVIDDRVYPAEFYVINRLTITLFDYTDHERMRQNGVTTNWDKLAVFQANIRVPKEMKIPKNAEIPERTLIMGKFATEVTEDLIQKVEYDFILPQFEAKISK